MAKYTMADLLERSKKEQELHERMNGLMDKVRGEDRVFTAEEQTSWAEMQREAEALKEQRASFQDFIGIRDETRGAIGGNPATETREPQTPDEMKKRIGEIAHALYLRKMGKELPESYRSINMETGAAGGVLIPDTMMRTIMAAMPQKGIIRPRAFVIPGGDAPNGDFEIPYFDQSSSVAGGIGYVQRGETTDMTISTGEFAALTLKALEHSTYIQVGKKTAQNGNVVGLGTFITNFFAREKDAREDYLFINGNGTNQPKGILSASCLKGVSRNTSSHLKFADVAAAYVGQMDNNGAVWIANKGAMQDLISMADGNGNNLIFKAGDVTKGIPATLLGYPILETTNAPALGSKGDLIFANLNYYIVKDGRSFEMSVYDVRPEKQLLDYVGVWDVDGNSWLANAITMKDGNTYSPFVTVNA